MIRSVRFRPKFEFLESRLLLNGDTADVYVQDPADDGSPPPAIVDDTSASESDDSGQPVDPTEDPVDPSNSRHVSDVTGLHSSDDGQLIAITVTDNGFGDASYTSVQIEHEGNTYLVDFTIVNNDGSYTFYFNDPIAADVIELGDQVTVVFGDGGGGDPYVDETEPPPDESGYEPGPEDPTETPIE